MLIHQLTLSAAIFLLIYHQLTTWLPLYPWNNIKTYSPKEILLEAGSNAVLMGLGIICIAFGNKGFYHYYPLFYYPFLLTGEFFQWWLPYFSDKFAKANMNFDYDLRFSNTKKLIPHKAGKRTPDANHIVLHFISLVTVILVFVDRLS